MEWRISDKWEHIENTDRITDGSLNHHFFAEEGSVSFSDLSIRGFF
jgi:hypothetical protein